MYDNCHEWAEDEDKVWEKSCNDETEYAVPGVFVVLEVL